LQTVARHVLSVSPIDDVVPLSVMAADFADALKRVDIDQRAHK